MDTTEHLVLNDEAIEAAKRSLDEGLVTPSYGPWRDDIVKLLNDALATELVCVLRYKRHYRRQGPDHAASSRGRAE
jgi:bacterioferritin